MYIVSAFHSGSHIFYLTAEENVVKAYYTTILYHGYGEKSVQFDLGNCTGQNKTNTFHMVSILQDLLQF